MVKVARNPEAETNRAWKLLVGRLDETGSPLKLELYKRIVSAILDYRLAPGSQMPSTRILAQELDLSRNTVIAAYAHLTAEGYIRPQTKSRYVVQEASVILDMLPEDAAQQGALSETSSVRWGDRMIGSVAGLSRYTRTSLWRACRYPFVYGQHDPQTFPFAQWREVERAALSMPVVRDWAGDPYDDDDPSLIEQIRVRLLPKRGVWAQPNQILVTVGTQNALTMIGMLLLAPGFHCALEEPGHPDVRDVLRLHTSNIHSVEVDQEGLRVGDLSPGVSLLYCTPGLQYPTMMEMSESRRRRLYRYAQENGTIIVEDDIDPEAHAGRMAKPALKSDDPDGRVIYIGNFSKGLAPGLRIGFIVAQQEVISELRLIRRLVLRGPPTNNQRMMAEFLARGYYDSLARKLRRVYQERAEELHAAVADELPEARLAPFMGGSASWLPLPEGIDAGELHERLLARGVFVEAGDRLFQHRPKRSSLLLGFSCIPLESIRAGVSIIGQALREMSAQA